MTQAKDSQVSCCRWSAGEERGDRVHNAVCLIREAGRAVVVWQGEREREKGGEREREKG